MLPSLTEAWSSQLPTASVTMVAPASAAATATSSLLVSMDTVSPAWASSATTGTARASSSATVTGLCPGRVDSPPTSTMSAPARAMARPRSTAARRSVRPSPLKESGVTLTIPMILTRAMQSVC